MIESESQLSRRCERRSHRPPGGSQGQLALIVPALYRAVVLSDVSIGFAAVAESDSEVMPFALRLIDGS